ncbi:MAG TPA: efflux RND transporter periplasmic adaptor subunit [Blastocatellia bacterium]
MTTTSGDKAGKFGRKTLWAVIMLAGCLLAAGLFAMTARPRKGSASGEAPAVEASKPDQGQVVLACPGRIEGATESIEVGSGIDGILGSVLVKEGDRVRAGQTLAIIDRTDTVDDLKAAQAAADSARQAKALLVLGSRDEERRGAAADKAAAEADYHQAELRYKRMEQLYATGVVSPDARDQAKRDFEVAQFKFKSASEHEVFVDKDPRKEELAKADADIRSADELAAKAAEMADKCKIRAPISGTILRCDMKAGETVSTVFPKPIITMADTSKMRVRAEVDERDIGRVFPGQQVSVLIDAMPQARLTGKVSKLESLMGRKKVRTGDPAEKSDRDVLEVLIDLDQAQAAKLPLVIGLRVTAQFVKAPGK